MRLKADVCNYHKDHLGSSGYLTDSLANIDEHTEYTPWGESWIKQQASDVLGNSLNYYFTGKEQDLTGLYYFGARYYDPQTSVWMSPDPILGKYLENVGKANQNNDKNSVFIGKNGGMDGALNSKNLALYTYAHQNPLTMIDPDGKSSIEAMFSMWAPNFAINQAKVEVEFTANEASKRAPYVVGGGLALAGMSYSIAAMGVATGVADLGLGLYGLAVNAWGLDVNRRGMMGEEISGLEATSQSLLSLGSNSMGTMQGFMKALKNPDDIGLLLYSVCGSIYDKIGIEKGAEKMSQDSLNNVMKIDVKK